MDVIDTAVLIALPEVAAGLLEEGLGVEAGVSLEESEAVEAQAARSEATFTASGQGEFAFARELAVADVEGASVVAKEAEISAKTVTTTSSGTVSGASQASQLELNLNSSIEVPNMKFGQGIQNQGEPFETYVASQYPKGSRLPPGFPTYDVNPPNTGIAISAKTLDTTTAARIAKPQQIYSQLKRYVNSTLDFEGGAIGGRALSPGNITARQVWVGIPENTTAAQWQQINRAILYGKDNNVSLVIKAIRTQQ